MIIHRLHLRNFCQHRELTLELMPGLNMLVGPNGSGKTNILRAIQFALVGDAGGDRTKGADICQGAAPGEPSFVEAELSHSGATMTVRRSIRPAENLLTIGDARWTSVGEINAELWRRLGATKKQIADYIFVRQRKVDEMFDQRPADRAASLAALFGVDHAEKVHKQLGEFLKHIEVPTTTLSEDASNAKISELAGDVATIDADIDALAMPANPTAVLHENQRLIQRHSDSNTAAIRVEQLQQQIGAKEAEIKTATGPLDELDGALADLESGLAAIADDCVASTAGLEQWRAYRASEATRQALATDRAAFDTKWAGLAAPTQPSVDKLLEAELVSLDGLKSRRVEICIALKDHEDGDTCPTCGQMMPGADERAAHRVRLEQELALINGRTPPLQERRDSWVDFGNRAETYGERLRQQKIERDQLDTRQAALQTLDPPEADEQTLQQPLAEQSAFRAATQKLQAQKADKALRLSVLEGESKQLVTAHTAAQAEHNALQPWPTQAQRDVAFEDNRIILENQRTLDQLGRRRAVVDANLTAEQARLEEARLIKAQGQKTRDVVAHLNEVRNVFHRNEAPRMVSYTYVEQMLGQVNDSLELFEAPFRVEMDEHLGFTARFLDGVRVQPDCQLSVGERIVLAMAFRITVNSTFAGQVGVLIMDEPTAGLDEHNLSSLPRALDRLRDLSHERGLQVLFVTHEPRISHHFDNAIELSSA